MSDKWPHFGTEKSSVASDEAGSSSANGAEADDAVGVPDASIGEVATAQDEQAGETPVATDIADDSEVPGEAAVAGEAANGDDTPVAATATDAEATTADEAHGDDGAGFLTELVRAMQTTAGLERVRTDEETDRRRTAHIDGVRTREAAQADRIRELATDDMAAIDAWADGETKRIQAERERRAAELNKDLETSLSEHHAKIGREIEGVELAIASYRAAVATFFEGLDRETDLVVIAQLAARRPVFPILESGEDAAAAREAAQGADAAAEPRPAVVGVMDPAAADAPESIDSPAPVADATPEPAEQAETAEPVTAAIGSGQSASEPLLQTVPAHRPMSWLRRDSNGGDRPNADD